MSTPSFITHPSNGNRKKSSSINATPLSDVTNVNIHSTRTPRKTLNQEEEDSGNIHGSNSTSNNKKIGPGKFVLNHGRISRSISFNHEVLHHNGSGDQNGVVSLAEDDHGLPLQNTQNNPHLLGIFNEVQITHSDSESSEQIEDAEDEVLNQQREGIDV
ncbi:hypothetical protein SESBI_21194 [Sesbania bispinosa]|nr:hypothetical protein SESBI_21194 [Sesbania bispinosa]